MRSPLEYIDKNVEIGSKGYVENLKDRLQGKWMKCKRNDRKSRRQQAIQLDKKSMESEYKPGNYVYLSDPSLEARGIRKFHRPWKAPFRVIEGIPTFNL